MFVVTFHGGSGGIQTPYSYPDQGGDTGTPYLVAATPSGTNGFRDVQFLPPEAGGDFYLVNSYKKASEVFQISPTATSVPSPFVSDSGSSAVCSVYHPFGLAFDSAMDVLYISNQDSNGVIRCYGPNAGATAGLPMPVSPALSNLFANGVFLPGTFVASQVPLTPPGWSDLPTAVDTEQGGLALSPANLKPTDTPSNSVRGVAVLGSTLYVADEVANLLRQYDTTSGAYLGAVADPNGLISSPVHVLVNAGLLYVTVEPGTTNSDALVVAYNPANSTLSTVVTQSQSDLDIKHPSGMTFDGQGNFYLADLDGMAVYRFGPTFDPPSGPFISNLPDQPEFVLWVDDAWVEA